MYPFRQPRLIISWHAVAVLTIASDSRMSANRASSSGPHESPDISACTFHTVHAECSEVYVVCGA